jgi:hypothetical protein
MIKKICLIAAPIIFMYAICLHGEEITLHEYRGVITFHLIPAKVIRINKIIENPKPGTSYIGEKSILVDVDENPQVMANWTVVKIKYYKYQEPKIIKYKILSEQNEISVNYHAVSVLIDGDLSTYINKP